MNARDFTKKGFEEKLEKALKQIKVKSTPKFMHGCLSEGDYGTYREGFGIDIKGSVEKARDIRDKLEEYFSEYYDISFYCGPQSCESWFNLDCPEDSLKYSHIELIVRGYFAR